MRGGKWYGVSEVVDADRANYRNVIEDIVDKYPGRYGDTYSVFYWCHDTKMNIPLTNDHDLVEMFAKNKASKCCWMSLAYYKPNTVPPVIPSWDPITEQSIEPPITPSMATPSIATPSIACPSNAPPSIAESTQTQSTACADDDILANPNPENEHMGVDDEGLYLDLPPPPKPQQPTPPEDQIQTATTERCPSPKPAESETESDSPKPAESETESDASSGSDDEFDPEMDPDEADEMVKDHEPDYMAPLEYDKRNPPMCVGSMYPDMFEFKMALATHAAIKENRYFIQKSDTGRYRVYCLWRNEGCPWRIHASTMRDGKTIQVISSSKF